MSHDAAALSKTELDTVLALIDAIYQTVAEPDQWPQVLERISHHMGIGCAGISLVDTRTFEIRVAAHWGAPPEFMQAMMNSIHINPATTAHWYMEVDQPFTIETLLGREKYLNSRFYRTVNAPHNCVDGLISILNRSGDRYGNISLPRWTEHGPITAKDHERLRRLAPHIRRAVTLTDLLDSQSLAHSLLSQTFDQLSTAIMLIDMNGTILQANRAAEALMEVAILLKRQGDALMICDGQGAKAFKEALNQLKEATPSQMAQAVNIALACAPHEAVNGWILPLRADLDRLSHGAKPAVAALMIGASAEKLLPISQFVQGFKLTPAQVRVVSLLTQGHVPVEIADILGVSIHTVRSHMQQIFFKTDTKGLPELLHLCQRQLVPILA